MEAPLQRMDDAFTDKYSRYGALLFRLSMAFLGNPQDAEDIMQEAFIKLLYHAPAFRDEEHERRWLLRVTVNLCKNACKRSNRQRPVEPGDPVFDRLDTEERELFSLFAALPETYKSALYLHSVAGYSVKETASLLRLTASAVKMRLTRGRALLQKEMEDSDETARSEKSV